MVGIRDVIHEYYFSCGNWDLMEKKLGVSKKNENCPNERLACITESYLNSLNFNVDMKKIIDTNNAILLGVNNLYKKISNKQLENKIITIPGKEKPSDKVPEYNTSSDIWKGKGFQNDGQSWSILIKQQSSRWFIEYPSLACGGELKCLEVKKNHMKFREDITVGTDKCFNGGLIELHMKNDNTAEYYWYYPNGKKGAEGIIYKEK